LNYPNRAAIIDGAVILALLGYGYSVVMLAATLASSRHAISLTYTYDPKADEPAWTDLPAQDTDTTEGY
jgi:hypothetical protein